MVPSKILFGLSVRDTICCVFKHWSKLSVCRKPWAKVSLIPVTLMSRYDSHFECSNISENENKLDGRGLAVLTIAIENQGD